MLELELPARRWSVAAADRLVGREEELSAVDRALDGGPRALVLAGGAGVGKTRLARDALAAAEQRGDWTPF